MHERKRDDSGLGGRYREIDRRVEAAEVDQRGLHGQRQQDKQSEIGERKFPELVIAEGEQAEEGQGIEHRRLETDLVLPQGRHPHPAR
jgi:hypothetical protein